MLLILSGINLRNPNSNCSVAESLNFALSSSKDYLKKKKKCFEINLNGTMKCQK